VTTNIIHLLSVGPCVELLFNRVCINILKYMAIDLLIQREIL